MGEQIVVITPIVPTAIEVGTMGLTKAQQLENRKLELEITRMEREQGLVDGSPVANGEFALIGPVDDDIYDLMHKMDIWSRNHPKADITLVINSPGGTVVDGFAFYDFLQILKRRGHYITTKGLGLQASMGGILLQVGDHRTMSPRSWMLIHEVQGIADGSFSEMSNLVKFNERLQNQALDILAAKSAWTRAKIKKTWVADTFLDANDALQAGFVDEVEDD